MTKRTPGPARKLTPTETRSATTNHHIRTRPMSGKRPSKRHHRQKARLAAAGVHPMTKTTLLLLPLHELSLSALADRHGIESDSNPKTTSRPSSSLTPGLAVLSQTHNLSQAGIRPGRQAMITPLVDRMRSGPQPRNRHNKSLIRCWNKSVGV